MIDYDLILDRLNKSNFRKSFYLKKNDIEYINKKGIETIKGHAYDFINKRLAPAVIINDGKQTPMQLRLVAGSVYLNGIK